MNINFDLGDLYWWLKSNILLGLRLSWLKGGLGFGEIRLKICNKSDWDSEIKNLEFFSPESRIRWKK